MNRNYFLLNSNFSKLRQFHQLIYNNPEIYKQFNDDKLKIIVDHMEKLNALLSNCMDSIEEPHKA